MNNILVLKIIYLYKKILEQARKIWKNIYKMNQNAPYKNSFSSFWKNKLSYRMKACENIYTVKKKNHSS